MRAASEGIVTSRLRENITLVALAGALTVAMTACSAPASDALTRTLPEPSMANALGARVVSQGSTGGDEVKGRRVETPKEARVDEVHRRCPGSMVEIPGYASMGSSGGAFCIDRYEGSLVDVLPNGEERDHSPFLPVEPQARVRAVSSANVIPQGYISAVEAQRACSASGKRLCRVGEWTQACRGPEPKAFGYADRREPGRCNDNGKNPVISLYGRGHWTWNTMNQPVLNQQEHTLLRTGELPGCTNGYGVYDMVGNLHEWVADPGGSFYGGYYQDVASVGHGEGCGYRTTAHEARYHDYSTGFRCCSDVAGAGEPPSEPAPAKAAPAAPRKKRRAPKR